MYYLAENAVVVGDVRIGSEASIWYGAVIRGDINYIEIGDGTNIQDLCVLHVTEELPVKIGRYVTVGHGAIIHGAEIGDFCLIGMGAIILDGAKIGEGSIVAAGAVVREKEEIPPYSLVAGVPAQIKKKLDEKIKEKIKAHSLNYIEYAKRLLKRVEK